MRPRGGVARWLRGDVRVNCAVIAAVVLGMAMSSVAAGYIVLFRLPQLTSGVATDRIAVNQTVAIDGVELAFGPSRYDAVGVPGATPEAGHTFLIKQLVVTNTTALTVQFFPSLSMYMRDNQGDTYGMRLVALAHPFEAGDIPAGATRTGEVAFEVPTRPLVFGLYLEPSWTSRGVLTFVP